MTSPATSVLTSLAHAHREATLAFERATGLSDTRFRVLACIANGQGAMREIERQVRINQSVTSRMIAALEQEGLIERAEPDVERGRLYKLSQAGRVWFRSVSAKRATFEEQLLRRLKKQEMQQLLELLGKVSAGAEALNQTYV